MKTDYKKAYDDIAVSAELHERLSDIPEDAKSSHKRSALFKAAAAVAAVFVMLFSADMISYAVTGEGVAERIQRAVGKPEKAGIKSVTLNGKQVNDFDIYDDKDGINITVEINDPLYGNILVITDGNAENIFIEAPPPIYVHDEDDRVFFIAERANIKIDITDDIADGSAEGEFAADGIRYSYTVYKDNGEYECSIREAER